MPWPKRCVEWFDRHWMRITIPIFIGTAVLVAADIAIHWSDLRRVNWLFITAYVPAIYILIRSTELPERIRAVRHSLIRQGILEVCELDASGHAQPLESTDALSRLEDEMEEEVFKRTASTTIVSVIIGVPLVMLVGIHRPLDDWMARLEYGLGLVYVALLCVRFGRALGFGRLMWGYRNVVLRDGGRSYGIHPRPRPGHADGHCGFRLVNDFWSYEAGLLIPLLIYTLGWLAVFGSDAGAAVFPNFDRLYPGHEPVSVFFWLSAFLIVLQILALCLPVLALRVIMGRAKAEFRHDADEVALNVYTLKQELLNPESPPEEKEKAAKSLEYALNAYHDYENVPLWPISGGTLRKYLLHLWSPIAFLGIVSAEDIRATSLSWITAGQPVEVGFVNDSDETLKIAYIGPARCWYAGEIPTAPFEIEPGKRSRPYASEALNHRCRDLGLEPFFSVWVARGEVQMGPVTVIRASREGCDEPADGACVRVFMQPAGIEAEVERSGNVHWIQFHVEETM